MLDYVKYNLTFYVEFLNMLNEEKNVIFEEETQLLFYQLLF